MSSLTLRAALWKVVEEQELEGLVAKPLGSLYKPGERGWLKVKNRAYWKYAIEREAIAERRTRTRSSREPLTV